MSHSHTRFADYVDQFGDRNDQRCDHYMARGDGMYYCERELGHPHGHSAETEQIGILVQWNSGDVGDGTL